MTYLPTYVFVVLLLAVAFGTVLTAQSGGRRQATQDVAHVDAQSGALAIGLRLAASPSR